MEGNALFIEGVPSVGPLLQRRHTIKYVAVLKHSETADLQYTSDSTPSEASDNTRRTL
jgi:hypothetical protein